MKRIFITFLASICAAHADPQLTSWFTTNSGKYARIFPTSADEPTAVPLKAGTPITTWSRGSGVQSSPAYADVSEINYSASWVYIRTSGLASHIMGPWYLNAAKTNLFPNYPANTAIIYRIPRTPTIPNTKTATAGGATGRMVNGVSMFDSRDAMSYRNSSGADGSMGVTGDGIWNRDGYHNEGVTFDPALAHQAGKDYHYHAQPIALRYQLGDHVDYNAATNRYTESAAAITTHSPIVAWAADGLPVYGPYGFSDPTNAASSVRRMVSGFTLRNGTNGTTAITVRQILPLWAQRFQNKTTLTSTQYGPAINTTYLLGHYIEDFDYRGDLAGQTQTTGATIGYYDLNEQNVRFCKTPEFPNGTWAYFTTINSDGTPQYPYTTGRQYYGNPIGGSVTTLPAAYMGTTESVQATPTFLGGPSTALTINTPAVTGTSVTLTWDAVEGGTYSVDASTNQSSWTSKGTGIVSTGTTAMKNYTALGSTGTEYGRVNRTALATYDTNGLSTATVAQSTTTPVILSLLAPTLTSLPAFSQGTSKAITFSTVTSATGYTIQASTVANFSSVLSSQNVASPSATFTSLSSGTLYYYRASATNASLTSPSSNTVSSTQDASSPTLAITTPATGSNTTHGTVIVSGTASDTISGMASLSVNGTTATTADGYAHWTATVPLTSGANSLPAVATDNVGNTTSNSLSITCNVSTQNDGLPDFWKTANSIDPNSANPINGPLGDIDFDGRTNLLEYAFNTNAQSFDAESVSFDTSSGFLELSFPRRVGALDLVYAVEVSDALLTWSSAPENFQVLSTTPNVNGITETVVVRVLAPTTSTMRKLARVRVSQQ